jgi:hypothetical protein
MPDTTAPVERAAIDDQRLTARLAEIVMGWRVTGGRFLMGNRRWAPRWRFQPLKKIADAMRLLEMAAPTTCSMNCDSGGTFHVRVRVAGQVGEAHNKSKARAITYAIATALGREMEKPR